MPNIGPVELVIILVVALLVIGPGKLPDVGAALGKSIREFRKAATDVQESVKIDAPATPVAPATPPAPAPLPVAAVPIEPMPAPNTLRAEASPNTLGASPASGPDASAADAPTESRV